MQIKGGKIFQNGVFIENTGLVTDGKFICTVGQENDFDKESARNAINPEKLMQEEVVDATGCLIIPGPIDIHFHGCAGADFCDATLEALHKISAYELSCGITSIHPASMTLSEEMLHKIFKNAVHFREIQQAEEEHFKTEAELVGIYMEGPFINMEKKGAQNPAYVRNPDLEMFHRLQESASGLIHVCIVAPEEPGAEAFVEQASKEVRISVGHTGADFMQAAKAFEMGASQVTHLYNAMPPFSHRAPGVIGAACDDEKTRVEMICDGIHLHPSTIRTSFKMFGKDRIILISDSMSATGMEDGAYMLGGQNVTVRKKLATLTDNGAIAGSATTLFDCMRYAVKEAGISLEAVIQCATENPAKAVGIWNQYGSLEKGKNADLVIMDDKMNICHIVKHGKIVK